MNRHRRKIALLFLGVVLFVIGSRLCAVADAQLSDREFHLIQVYFNLGNEFISLRKERTEEENRLATQFSQGDRKGYGEALQELEVMFNGRKKEIFLKYGITEQEYTETQTEILRNPGKLKDYVMAGGIVPKNENKEKPDASLTAEERLRREGILLDPLNTEILEKAFTDPRLTVQLDVMSVLEKMKPPIAKPYLLKQLQHELIFIRLKSAGALCQIDVFDGIPLILQALMDEKQDYPSRLSAISSAGLCLKDQVIAKKLFELFTEESNGSVRLQIALQIDQGGDVSMLDELKKIQTTEKDAMVRSLIDNTVRTWERKKRIQELGGSDVYK